MAALGRAAWSDSNRRHYVSVKQRSVIDRSLRAFFRDKRAVAFVFGMAALIGLYVWWLLDDIGALMAAIIFAGISAQQLYRFYLQKRDTGNGSD